MLNWPHFRLAQMPEMRGGNFAMSFIEFQGKVLKHGGKFTFAVE